MMLSEVHFYGSINLVKQKQSFSDVSQISSSEECPKVDGETQDVFEINLQDDGILSIYSYASVFRIAISQNISWRLTLKEVMCDTGQGVQEWTK